MLGIIQEIGEPCGTGFNAGYLTHLFLIRTTDVAYTNSPLNNSLTQPLTSIGIATDARVTKFQIKPKTATFTEGESLTPDGPVYTMALAVPLRGAANNVVSWIFENASNRFVVICRDTLGNCYMAGAMDNGAKVTWNRQVSNTSSQQINLTLNNWHPMQWLPSIDLEELFPNREFDYSFDLSFS